MFDGLRFTCAFAPLNGYGDVVRTRTTIDAAGQLPRVLLKLVVLRAAGTW